MGLFDTIARIGTGIVTGGTSELVRLIAPGVAEKATQLYFPTTIKQGLTTAGLVALPLGISSAVVAAQKPGATWDPTHNVFVNPAHGVPVAGPSTPSIFRYPTGSTFAAGGVQPMALNIGGILGQVGQIFGGGQNQVFDVLSGGANLASQFFPPPSVPAVQQPRAMTVANVPMRLGTTSLSTLTNEVITAGGKLLATLGIPVRSGGAFAGILKRALTSIASLARRTPAGTIISILAGLGLTAYESNLLVAWHAQRKRGRRMNPANAKALRRAARRIRGFHKLCTHTDVLRTRGRSRGSVAYAAAPRCRTCRKSPCRC